MQIITRQTLAANVIERFQNQYRGQLKSGQWDKREILDDLRDLGPNPDPDDVNGVMGNNSWTNVPSCSECGRENPPMVIMMGEPLDYESRTAWLCKDCISAAHEAMTKAEE